MAIRIGTDRPNVINGTYASDLIFGFGGGDLINAGAGNDIVYGGSGNDQIFGGDGSDWLYGGAGNDSVFGGNGADFLFGGVGNDVLNGGRGSDLVDGGAGADTLIFTDSERGGADRYAGGNGADTLVLEFDASRWANAAVKAEVLAYLDFLASGRTGDFNFTTMNLVVNSLETLIVKVNGVIIDPRPVVNTPPTGQADSYSTGENAVLNVSPASGLPSLVANDMTGSGAFSVELVSGPPKGVLLLNPNGTFNFNPGADFDYLKAGETATQTFTYRIVNSAGVSSPVTVTLSIAGANDAAAISGTLIGAVTEDAPSNSASGVVTVSDLDAGQALLANAGTIAGAYGTLTLSANGAWTYVLDNSLAATQALAAGVTATESFSIASLDGTAASVITVSVNGSNDAASFSGDLAASLGEDIFSLETEAPVLTATGSIAVSDADTGQAGIGNPGTYIGQYGSLQLAADGNWIYTLNNDSLAVQSLRGSDEVIDSFVISARDGTATSLDISITGQNDAANVTGDFTGSINFSEGPLLTSGVINVSDIDLGESGVVASVTEGLHGVLFLSENGEWTYALTGYESLPVGEPVNFQEHFSLLTLGGDTFNVTINVWDNDAPAV